MNNVDNIQGLDDDQTTNTITIYHEESKEPYSIPLYIVNLSSLIGTAMYGSYFEVAKTPKDLNKSYPCLSDEQTTFYSIKVPHCTYTVKGKELIRVDTYDTVNSLEDFERIISFLQSYENPEKILRYHTTDLPYDFNKGFLPNELLFFNGLLNRAKASLNDKEALFCTLSPYHNISLLLLKVAPFMRTVNYFGFDCIVNLYTEWYLNLIYTELNKLPKDEKDQLFRTFIAHHKHILTRARNTVCYLKEKKKGRTPEMDEVPFLFSRAVQTFMDETGLLCRETAEKAVETATYVIPGFVKLNKTVNYAKECIKKESERVSAVVSNQPIKCNYLNLL
jgi:hypothetical protein